jgi:hypothetical protein
LGDPGDLARLASVAARAQADDPAFADRGHVVGPVVGEPVPVVINTRCPHNHNDLLTSGYDLLKLGPESQLRLAAQRFLQFPATVTGLRLRILLAWHNMSPFQVRVNKIHHPPDIPTVVGQECLANDPLVLVTHREPLMTVCQPGAVASWQHSFPPRNDHNKPAAPGKRPQCDNQAKG